MQSWRLQLKTVVSPNNDKHHGVAAIDFSISKHGEPQLPCMFLLFGAYYVV
jgi:hypothetical protein